jgi:hypothetical protein
VHFSFAVERTAKEKLSACASIEAEVIFFICASTKIPKDADFCFPASQRKAKNKNNLCVLSVFAVNINIKSDSLSGGYLNLLEQDTGRRPVLRSLLVIAPYEPESICKSELRDMSRAGCC